VRSEIVRVYKAVHTWTGIVAGMALFIAFYAGAITVFKEPLVRWATPPAAAESAAQVVPLSEAHALVARTLASQPAAARELRLHLGLAAEPVERLEWEVREEGADEHDRLSSRHFTATLGDDGTVHAHEVERSHLGELIDVLHRVVGLPVDVDETRIVMGVIAALYFLALVSGFIVLLPSLVKDFFALRVGPNLKRMWLDAHNVVGIGSFPFHVVMALTAAVFAFHDGIYVVQDRMIHDGKLGAIFQGRRGSSEGDPRDPATMVPPDEIVARVTELAPSFEPTMLQYVNATGPKAMVRVWGHDTRALEHRALGGFALVDPYSGRVVSTEYLPGRQSAAATVLTSIFALHFATYGGQPVKWIYFALGLLGAWLFFSGNLLWIESRRRKAKKRVANGAIPVQRRDVRLMAAATVGVCLGAVCGISLTIVAAKWLHGHVADLNAWHRIVHYVAFFAAVGWAFFRGAARASVDLLRAAAATTLAIPLTTLLAALVPSLGMWARTEPGALGVDVTALVLGLVFAGMARSAARRVQEGPADSPWSAHAPPDPEPVAVTEPAVEAELHGEHAG